LGGFAGPDHAVIDATMSGLVEIEQVDECEVFENERWSFHKWSKTLGSERKRYTTRSGDSMDGWFENSIKDLDGTMRTADQATVEVDVNLYRGRIVNIEPWQWTSSWVLEPLVSLYNKPKKYVKTGNGSDPRIVIDFEESSDCTAGWVYAIQFEHIDLALARGYRRSTTKNYGGGIRSVRTRRWVRTRKRRVYVQRGDCVPMLKPIFYESVFESYLGKRSKGGMWKNRYFKLLRNENQYKLEYYDSKRYQSKVRGFPIGPETEISDSYGCRFTLRLQKKDCADSSNLGLFVLNADTQEQKQRWLRLLREVQWDCSTKKSQLNSLSSTESAPQFQTSQKVFPVSTKWGMKSSSFIAQDPTLLTSRRIVEAIPEEESPLLDLGVQPNHRNALLVLKTGFVLLLLLFTHGIICSSS